MPRSAQNTNKNAGNAATHVASIERTTLANIFISYPFQIIRLFYLDAFNEQFIALYFKNAKLSIL